MRAPARQGGRLPRAAVATALVLGWGGFGHLSTARAAADLQGMFEDESQLAANPAGTMAQIRMLGATEVRLSVTWRDIAPNPNSPRAPSFKSTDPAAYPARNWATLDAIVNEIKHSGVTVNFDVAGPAPRWAIGPAAPRGNTNYNWDPSPSKYGQFVQALATRYSGSYNPKTRRLAPGDPDDLPRVSFWSVWNEPDYGPSLAPQGVLSNLKIENSPRMYRNLVDAAWTALHRTGHGSDTFVWGELAPRGKPFWGVFSGMKPLVFLRALFCVDSHYKPLAGSDAAVRGCPTTAAGSRRFRGQHPGLFAASGVSDHPYMRWYQPNREVQPDRDYSSLGQIGNLERALDRLQLVYGSHTKFPIWNTEFGYLTAPPKHDNQVEPGGARYPWVTQTTAAYYLNWAEYISWRDPRLQSFIQYLLKDPLPSTRATDWGGFASGLINYNGTRKPGYDAWRLPLYLPVTRAHAGQKLEVWGCARPAEFAARDTGQGQSVDIQFKPHGQDTYSTVQTVPLPSAASDCYFDVRASFPSSGTVRLSWNYPSGDSQLNYFDPMESHTAESREVAITLT